MAVVIETTLGDITVDLYLEQRPVTCLNFLKLCKMKYYNFNLFHTIRSGFIAQTGDPTGEGSGGQSIFGVLEGRDKRFFSGEKMPKIRHTDTGLLSMVCTGDMMVGSQFFLTLGPDLDSLDGVHCVIGEVTEGHEILRKLNDVICDETHRPYQDVRITHIVVLEDPFNDPTGLRAPSRSPSPSAERLKGGRIAPDEELDETQGKSAAEVQEIIEEKEAKARATILEIVGDLPDADIAPPENVLFVCKLNPVTTDEDLEIIFSRFGQIVSCEVIRDKKTGDSLQYAFIEFDDKKSCENAYFKMDNVLIDDRRIHVDFSQSVSKMKWLGKGRGVKYFNDDDSKDNQNDNYTFKHSRSQERDRKQRNAREHRNNKEYRSDNEYKNKREARIDRENKNDREIKKGREHKNDGHHKKERDYKVERHNYTKIYESKEINREDRHNARERNIESESSRKGRPRSRSRSGLEKQNDQNSKKSSNYSHNLQNNQMINNDYIEKDSTNKYNSNKGVENNSFGKSRSSLSNTRSSRSDTDRSSSRRNRIDLPIRDDREKYERHKDQDEQIKQKTNKHMSNTRKHERESHKNKVEPRTPSPKTKEKNERSSAKRKLKGEKTNKNKLSSKKKRKPSTSSSESNSSDSSSSSTDSTSSSDSDRKKKSIRRRKKRHSSSSSSTSSSSSSTSSSSSDSSSSSSSSDSDSSEKTKKKTKKVVNKSKKKL